jgi:biofilm PGA synthesis N-glycosyltransferase PgaC
MLVSTVVFINLCILLYFIAVSLGYLILLFASIPDIILRFKENEVGNITSLMKSRTMPPVTMVMVAYNEENDILEAIYSILRSDYPNFSILIINNGSTDNTLGKLISTFDLYKVPDVIPLKIKPYGKILGSYHSKKDKRISVIDKTYTDKSDGLNVGVNACRTPLFLCIDADTLVEPDTITRAIFAMLVVPHTVAVGGAVYILNGCKFKDGVMLDVTMSSQPIHAVQTAEYLRSFLFSRSGWNTFGGSLSYAGAFTLFETQALRDVGGFDLDNFANDFEIIVHLHAYGREHGYPYKIRYTPAAIAWTDVPGTLKSYWRQRINWQYGSLLSLMKHKRMFFNPKYGITGLFTYPFFLLGEVLGGVVEFLAYLMVFAAWYLNIFDIYIVFLFMLVSWGFVAALTMATTLISFVTFNQYKRMRDLVKMLLIVIFEQFGFRQYGVICKVYATFQFCRDRLLLFWRRNKNRELVKEG